MMAEEEGRAISKRTKEALAAAKRRGTVLGGYRGAKITRRIREAGNSAQRQLAKRRAGDLLPIINELRAGGATSLKAVADGLNARNIPTAHGGKWQPTQVMRVLARQIIVGLAQRPDKSWSAILAGLPLADWLNSPLPTVANDIPAMPGRVRSSAISPIG